VVAAEDSEVVAAAVVGVAAEVSAVVIVTKASVVVAAAEVSAVAIATKASVVVTVAEASVAAIEMMASVAVIVAVASVVAAVAVENSVISVSIDLFHIVESCSSIFWYVLEREFMTDSLYVGQLPNDIQESDLKKLFPKASKISLVAAEGTRPGYVSLKCL
jgi:hypothetical protein